MKVIDTIEQKVVVQDEVVALTCDKCGRAVSKYSDDPEERMEFDEFLVISKMGGYGAVIGDMHYLEVELCQHCMVEVLGEYARVYPDPSFFIGDAVEEIKGE